MSCIGVLVVRFEHHEVQSTCLGCLAGCRGSGWESVSSPAQQNRVLALLGLTRQHPDRSPRQSASHGRLKSLTLCLTEVGCRARCDCIVRPLLLCRSIERGYRRWRSVLRVCCSTDCIRRRLQPDLSGGSARAASLHRITSTAATVSHSSRCTGGSGSAGRVRGRGELLQPWLSRSIRVEGEIRDWHDCCSYNDEATAAALQRLVRRGRELERTRWNGQRWGGMVGPQRLHCWQHSVSQWHY